jgi:ADP-heptose:LPS heptosyltransferase
LNLDRPIKRILLIRRHALGDALVTLPAIAEVRAAWPEARIDLVMDRPFAPLLAGLVTDVDVLPYPAADGTPWLRFLRKAGYDLVIDWLSTPQTALWSIVTGAPLRVGYDLRRRWWAYNIRVPRNREAGIGLRSFAGESFLDPLRSMGILPQPWQEGIAAAGVSGDIDRAVGPEVTEWLERWSGRPGSRIAVVMSATWTAKAWPAAHIRELLRLMNGGGLNPVLVAGPGDEALVEALKPSLAEHFWAPPTNLPELLKLLQASALFVGTDCGVRHLAASIGVPTVTLFGPTDAGGWNPANPNHVSVRVGQDCSPCDLTSCPLPGHPCMADLSPAMVMEAVSRSLDRQAAGRTT